MTRLALLLALPLLLAIPAPAGSQAPETPTVAPVVVVTVREGG